ncbi:MAG TPA: zinc ribbon domain-containing protein [Candidatus Acidoferrum sp.]|nr:zinc ribbon domain-containing protein [Candidatus Acidoferrum sp.]
MPLYEYQCAKCGKRTEKIEKLSGPHLKKCPHCGGKVERMLTAPAIQFKGSGWYVTDYAGKSSAKEAGKAEAGKAEAPGSETKEASSGKETAAKDSGTKDAKEKKSGKKK